MSAVPLAPWQPESPATCYEFAIDVAAHLARRRGEALSGFLDGPGADFVLSRELRRAGFMPATRDAVIERLLAED